MLSGIRRRGTPPALCIMPPHVGLHALVLRTCTAPAPALTCPCDPTWASPEPSLVGALRAAGRSPAILQDPGFAHVAARPPARFGPDLIPGGQGVYLVYVSKYYLRQTVFGASLGPQRPPRPQAPQPPPPAPPPQPRPGRRPSPRPRSTPPGRTAGPCLPGAGSRSAAQPPCGSAGRGAAGSAHRGRPRRRGWAECSRGNAAGVPRQGGRRRQEACALARPGKRRAPTGRPASSLARRIVSDGQPTAQAEVHGQSGIPGKSRR